MPQALSAAQVRYLRDVLHYWPLPAGLLSLGPINAHAYRTKDRSYDVDVHEMPDGARYTEITRKVPLADADDAFRTLQAYLANAGIAECADRSGAGRQQAARPAAAALSVSRLARACQGARDSPASGRSTPSRRDTRIGVSARWKRATSSCNCRSAIVIRERSRTYSAHESMM